MLQCVGYNDQVNVTVVGWVGQSGIDYRYNPVFTAIVLIEIECFGTIKILLL